MGENTLKEPTIKEYGRFRYIEPNDVLENNRYSKSGTDESFNITSPYEDYCIDVELEVKIPNRGVWVADLSGNSKVGVTSNEGKTISFFSGDDSGFLSDTPASLIYKDLLSGKQDRESLGITNIHVTYNSYYVPEVTIKFTDIRGMGLMMPHEEVYRQERALIKNTPQIEKFFAALFTFPSPEFLLRIKGFYGKKVEYSLVVSSDFKSSFNSQTGNFEATVKFIGKMYGMYTDIPMAYLLVAPYCTYGSTDNKTIWDERQFKFPGTNTPIPKLLELETKLIEGVKETKEIIAQNIDADLVNVYQKSNSLTSVINNYNEFKTYIDNISKSQDNGTNIITDGDIFLFVDKGERNGDAGYAYNYLYPEENSKLRTITDNLYKSISDFNGGYACNLSYIGGLPKNKKIGENTVYLASITRKEDDTITITFDEKGNVNFNVDDFPALKDKLKKTLLRTTSEFFYVVNAIKFNEGIKELQAEISDKIKKAEEEKNKEVNVVIERVLGFKPSIKNMFIILMAHLQTFMEIFNACINNINTDVSRTIKRKGLTLNNLPDIPSYISLDSQLPPFPAFKKTLNNELCYPNEAGIKGSMAETSLIDQMFVGCDTLTKEVVKNDVVTENIQTPAQEKPFIPTCITDYNCYINNGYSESNNPYSVLSKAPDSKMHWIWFYFAMRCIQKFIMERGDDLKPENFGAYEAYNLWLAMPKMDETTLNALTSADNGSTKFMEYLTKKEIKKCYELFDGYRLLYENGGEISPIQYTTNKKPSMPHIPARIGYDSDNVHNQFKKDAYDSTALFAFKYCTENHSTQGLETGWGKITVRQGHRPYGLMKEIPLENLKSWDEAIKKYSNIPNNYNDHTELVSKQIERNEGYYYNNKNNGLGGDKTSNTNPAWNVMCQKGTGGEFFQYISDPMPEKYGDMLCTLDDNLSSSETLHIHNIRRVDKDAGQCPLFLLKPESLKNKPERFLCPIPHNLERIINDLCAGKKIVHIPYATKLFIGFIIDKFNTLKDDEINDFINSIVDKCGGSSNNPNYKIEGVLDYQRSGSFAQMLLLLAGFFSTNNEGNIITPSAQININDGKINYPIASLKPDGQEISRTMISHSIKAMKNAGFFKIDTFGFVEEYKKWFKDETEGGFQWFVNTMCLDMNETPIETQLIVSKDGKKEDLDFTRDNTKNLLTTLKDFLKEKVVYKNLLYLQEKYKGEPKKACSNTENALNLLFKKENGKSFSEIYRGVYCYGKKGDVEYVYLRFNDEYVGVRALEKFLSKIVYFITPYTLCAETIKNEQTLKSTSDKFKTAFNSFITSLKSLYDIKIEEGNNKSTESSQTNASGHIPVTDERKFSMYTTLKNLYDKHLANINNEISKFYIEPKNKTIKNDREIDRFHFIDTYYQDIGDKLFINPDTVVSIIHDITHGYQTGVGEGVLSSEMSLYSFMGLLCQRHNMLLISVPVFNGTHSEFTHDNLKKMFTPISHSNAKNENVLHGPSHICFYPHKTSQHLNIPISQYQDDGFLIENDDVNGTANFEGVSTVFELMKDGEYTIPAFGVEYGSQKQSIFKNINVNMDNPQTTEVAVATMFSIANNGEKGDKRLVGVGQDLYQIYSNYSYTCQVEMMGCAQIQPLMYFQLNNVPMFRGAYQIIHVEHDIVPGNMTTTFKGVRINKNIMPMASNFVTIKLNDVVSKKGTADSPSPSSPSSNFKYVPLDKTKVQSQNMANHTLSEVTADTLLNDEVLKKHVMFPDNTSQFKNLHNNVKVAFNRLCPTVRQFVYCLAKDLAEMSKELGYTIGIYINSAAREGANNGSYHKTSITSSDSKYTLRNAVKGTKVSDDGTGVVKNIPYSLMACAIDIQGLVMNTSPSKDGLYRGSIISGNSKGASLQIFHHIVDNYYKYIKELIWEIHGSTKSTDAKIDILHFASIGECSATNVGYVLMSKVTYANSKSKTTKITGNRNTFCSSFNEACDKIKAKNTHLKTTSYT